jgi:hypothetical protein
MIRKSVLKLVVASGLIAAAVALAPSAPKLPGAARTDTSHSNHYQGPRHVNRHTLDGCFSEPVECGLVVW